MELTVRLTAKDMNTGGVFAALERLCTCFKPEEFGSVTAVPGKDRAGTAPDTKAETGTAGGAQKAQPAAQPAETTAAQAAPKPPVQQTAAVPVAQPQQFTIPQIAQAAAIYSETSAEARAQVVELIHSFGAAALSDIPRDRLGEFATRLRGLGARI